MQLGCRVLCGSGRGRGCEREGHVAAVRVDVLERDAVAEVAVQVRVAGRGALLQRLEPRVQVPLGALQRAGVKAQSHYSDHA